MFRATFLRQGLGIRKVKKGGRPAPHPNFPASSHVQNPQYGSQTAVVGFWKGADRGNSASKFVFAGAPGLQLRGLCSHLSGSPRYVSDIAWCLLGFRLKEWHQKQVPTWSHRVPCFEHAHNQIVFLVRNSGTLRSTLQLVASSLSPEVKFGLHRGHDPWGMGEKAVVWCQGDLRRASSRRSHQVASEPNGKASGGPSAQDIAEPTCKRRNQHMTKLRTSNGKSFFFSWSRYNSENPRTATPGPNKEPIATNSSRSLASPSFD